MGQRLVLPSSCDQDLAHRLLWQLSQRDTRLTLHQGDIFGIALRRLEEDLRSGDAGILDAIHREVLLRGSTSRGDSSGKMLEDLL